MENPDYQKALREFTQSLRAAGIKSSPRIHTIDAVAGDTPAIFTGVFTVAGAALVYIRPFLLEWFKGRHERKVRLEVGDFKGEARTPKEMGKLLEQAEKYQQHRNPKIIP